MKKNNVLNKVFKKNSFEQLIRQAEIDVLGIDTMKNTLYACDIAFHTPYLNYGNRTSDKVVSKILRAVKLNQLDTRNKVRVAIPNKPHDTSELKPEKSMKIQPYIKNTMQSLHRDGKLTESILNDLQDREYCKKTFKVQCEVLRPSSQSRKDNKGHYRYYKDEIFPGYWLTSQWNKNKHGEKFRLWEDQFRK
ncbi:MAG: hypothetical protein OXE77_00100 [Flavobacteriaceae bacterium]|nr:hypothetical protein [Flavobacteriaceae bacterium]MCY4267005.1 hypothetical protein [Flavobacteriaceae bacterium]